MSEHPIVFENRLAKGTRLANAIKVLHAHLGRTDSLYDYANAQDEEWWHAIGKAIGEPKKPETSIPVALALLREQQELAS